MAAAVVVAAVAAVCVTNMPIAHYHLENISKENTLFVLTCSLKNKTYLRIFFKNSFPMAFPASGTYVVSSAAKFYS